MRPKLRIVKSKSTRYTLEYKRPDGSVLRLVNPLPTTDMAKKTKQSTEPGELRKRSIVIPEELMVLVEADAARCDRTVNGQITAILRAIYMHADVELHGLNRSQAVRKVTDEELERRVG